MRRLAEFCRLADDPREVGGREELRGRDGSREGAEEAVRLFLVAQQGPEELLHLGRRRLQAREVERAAKPPRGELVAALLIAGERRLELLAAREAVVDGSGQELGVAERVRDAEREDRVLVVAGVAHERPAVAEGAAEVVGQPGRATEAVAARGAADALGQPGGELERLQEIGLDVRADAMEVLIWPEGDRHHSSVVGG